MIKVLFVCLGNICRSPMAEFVLKDMLERQGISFQFTVASAGTSSEEEGNPVYRGAREELKRHGIDCGSKRARKVVFDDYFEYDFILAMEQRNIVNLLRIFGDDPACKIKRLLDFTVHPRDIADPWYTGDFEITYADILEGCSAFLQFLRAEKKI